MVGRFPSMRMLVVLKLVFSNHQVLTTASDTHQLSANSIRNVVFQKEFPVREATITFPELRRALKEGRVLEMFGTGTAACVIPIESIHYQESATNVEKLQVAPSDKKGDSVAQKLQNCFRELQVTVVFVNLLSTDFRVNVWNECLVRRIDDCTSVDSLCP